MSSWEQLGYLTNNPKKKLEQISNMTNETTQNNSTYSEEEDIFTTNQVLLEDIDYLNDCIHHNDVVLDYDSEQGNVSLQVQNASSYFNIPENVNDYTLVSFHQNYDVSDNKLICGSVIIIMVKKDMEMDVERWWTIRIPPN